MEKKSTFHNSLLQCALLLMLIAPLPALAASDRGGHSPGAVTAPRAFTVSGQVADANGPLAGVTVLEKGTTNGTTTTGSGHYRIEVASEDAVLVFSFIGYKTMEVPVSGRSVIDLTLVADARTLSNVVVTALGIKRQEKALGYSISEIKSEDLVKASNPNVMKALDGKISGVNFTNLSSDPTSSVMVNIRGTTVMPSISSGTNVSSRAQPLYVIDGVPVGTQTFTSKDNVDFGNILSQLNPEDIASITVLKGGSAGALYGAEGGNGVVMITTKSGNGLHKGLGVSYTLSALWDQAYQFFPEQMEYGQGERSFEWQFDNTDTWGPRLDGTTMADYWDVKAQQWKNGPMISSNEDRVKAYLQTGSTITNTVSVFGNYDKGSFRLSLSNMDNIGVMPNTKTNQKTFLLNSEYRVTDRLKLSVSSSYLRTYSPNKANSVGSNGILNQLLFNFPANLQPLADMHDYWLTGFEGVKQNGAIMKPNGIDVSDNNPWWMTYEYLHRFSRDNYFGKLQLDWQFTNELSLMVRTGMENVKESYELRKSWGGDGDPFGQFTTGTNSSLLANADAIVNYLKNVNKFSINVSLGGNYSYSNYNSLEANAGDLSSPSLFTLANAAPGTLTVSSTPYSISQGFSAYGMATLGYADQLFLDVTGRNDWKGVLDEEKIHYFYPSASLSWIASQTLQLPESFDMLKLRVGIADVGNGLLKRRSIDTYSFESSDWGPAKTVVLNASLVDPDIKPMHSVTQEAGLDLWMFNKRVMFDFTYFIKDQKNQLDNIPLVQGTGYSGMLTNIGDVRSKGFEWGLTVVPVNSGDWYWGLTASFTHYKATITRLSDKFAPNGYVFTGYDGKTTIKIAEGEEIGNIYEQNPILRVKSGKYAGMPLLDGEHGEFQASPDNNDRALLANFNPDFIVGLNTTVRYKRFTLNLVGSLRQGGHYVSVNQQYAESNGKAFTSIGSGSNNPYWQGGRDGDHGGLPWPTAGSSQYDAINANNDPQRTDVVNDASYAKGVFLHPDYTGDPEKATDADYIVNGADPNNTFYQIPYNSYGDVIWDFSSTRTYDATNFKLREVSLAYTLPTSLTSRYKLNNVTLSLIGRNLFQWNASGRNEDPESAFTGVGTNQGILRATLPSIRSFGFKLGVDF